MCYHLALIFFFFYSDLVGIEKFSPTLTELILDNNQVSEQTQFPKFKQLQLLSLCNNNVSLTAASNLISSGSKISQIIELA